MFTVMKIFTKYLVALFLLGILVSPPAIAQEKEASMAEKLQVFPNPSEGKFQLKLEYDGDEKLTAKVYDITGKVIEDISHELTREESSVTAWVDLKDPRSGIYFLRIQAGSELATKKIIVK